ncbi:MAG: hypothetical protein ACSHYF_06615 [Verrucomicrobiaceae bacterium]
MKLPLILLSLFSLNAAAELPIMTDSTKWLGYFVAWEEKTYDYGLGDDGKVKMHIVKGKEQVGHKDITINFKIQEEIKGKWVTRQPLEEGGLTTEAKAALNPREPVKVIFTVTGDTKVEIIQALSRGRVMIKPKFLEKKTENPVRIVVAVSVPDLYKIKEELDARELKKKIGSDTLEAKRAKDGKKIKVKLYETETDLSSEELLAEGALEISLSNKGNMGSKELNIEQGGDKVGVFEVKTGKKIYEGLKIDWIPNPDKLGEKDCYMSIAID